MGLEWGKVELFGRELIDLKKMVKGLKKVCFGLCM
jgi:hypothetical protein